jgi:methionine-rich copper-binding protein CopC
MKRAQIRALGALAFLFSAALLIPAGRAAAHAAYDHSTPAKDEVVPTAPSQVDVYFKQDVFKVAGQYYVRVFADDATTQVSTGDGTVDDNNRKHISATLPANLAQGRYIVKWHNVSDEDGDPDTGAFCFYIGVQPTAAQQAECASFEPTPVPTIAVGTASSSPVSTQTAAATAVPTPGSTSGGGSSSTGVIIGVVAGVIAAVVVVGGAGLWWRSRGA